MMHMITPFVMFKNRGQEAVNFYVSVLPEMNKLEISGLQAAYDGD